MQKYSLFYKFHDQLGLYEKITQFINDPSLRCANFYSYKIDYLWKAFESYFNCLEAAGGAVIRSGKDILFIRRYNRWDIPKGHIKTGEEPIECAKREIGEECGIPVENLRALLKPTYHTYPYGSRQYLKKTYWYLFEYDGPPETVPQESEGITEAVWKNLSDLPDIIPASWSSVADVLNEVILKLPVK